MTERSKHLTISERFLQPTTPNRAMPQRVGRKTTVNRFYLHFTGYELGVRGEKLCNPINTALDVVLVSILL